jgi:hypothetical protein
MVSMVPLLRVSQAKIKGIVMDTFWKLYRRMYYIYSGCWLNSILWSCGTEIPFCFASCRDGGCFQLLEVDLWDTASKPTITNWSFSNLKFPWHPPLSHYFYLFWLQLGKIPYFKSLCNYTRPTWKIQANPLILKFMSIIPSTESLHSGT